MYINVYNRYFLNNNFYYFYTIYSLHYKTIMKLFLSRSVVFPIILLIIALSIKATAYKKIRSKAIASTGLGSVKTKTSITDA